MNVFILAHMDPQTQTLIELALYLALACAGVGWLGWLLFQVEPRPVRLIARWRSVRRSAAAPALAAGKSDGESAPTKLLLFERPKLDAIGDRWSRAQLDGLVMSPYDVEGRRN